MPRWATSHNASQASNKAARQLAKLALTEGGAGKRRMVKEVAEIMKTNPGRTKLINRVARLEESVDQDKNRFPANMEGRIILSLHSDVLAFKWLLQLPDKKICKEQAGAKKVHDNKIASKIFKRVHVLDDNAKLGSMQHDAWLTAWSRRYVEMGGWPATLCWDTSFQLNFGGASDHWQLFPMSKDGATDEEVAEHTYEFLEIPGRRCSVKT